MTVGEYGMWVGTVLIGALASYDKSRVDEFEGDNLLNEKIMGLNSMAGLRFISLAKEYDVYQKRIISEYDCECNKE